MSSDFLRHDDELRQQIEQMGRGRWIVICYLIAATLGGIQAIYYLLDVGETWIARAVALLIVEPITVACLLALITLAAPDSLPAQFFRGALRRASVVVVLLGVSFVAGIAGMLIWSLWGYLSSR